MKTNLSRVILLVNILFVHEVVLMDVTELVSSLETVSALIGNIGGGPGGSTLVMALSGTSMKDCAISFQGVESSALTCLGFLDILSTCAALNKTKPILKAAKIKYMKTYPKRAFRPCFISSP